MIILDWAFYSNALNLIIPPYHRSETAGIRLPHYYGRSWADCEYWY